MRFVRLPRVASIQTNLYPQWLIAFGFAFSVFVFAANPAQADMSFQIVGNGSSTQIVAAQGEISNQTPAAFRAYLAEYGGANSHLTILLDSEGGGVQAAMELGKIFRRIGATVVVAQPGSGPRFAGGNCISACVYALMGGRKRVVPLESQVAVHRMFARESDNQYAGDRSERISHEGFAGRLAAYASSMGVSPAVVSLAEHTPTETVHSLTREEIARWHLADSN